MIKKLLACASALVLVAVVGSVMSSAVAAASNPILCPDIYAPVICSNGHIYPNQCYANVAKATNCHPYGQD